VAQSQIQLLAHEASFWLSPTIELARNLIGSLLVKQGEKSLVGRIVETEPTRSETRLHMHFVVALLDAPRCL
jgi:3-methyladenine DNA glycosylase Mpg